MIKQYCDMCKKLVTDNRILDVKIDATAKYYEYSDIHIDLCDDCFKAFREKLYALQNDDEKRGI
jgi:hypothetical protein